MVDKSLYHMYENGGMKENKGKKDYTLIPWNVMNEVVDVMMYGAQKYSRDNWRKVPYDEYIKASFRHLVDFIQGEIYDQESGFTHFAHAVCDILYAAENYFQSGEKVGREEVSEEEDEDEKRQYYLFDTDGSLEDKLHESDRIADEIESIFNGLNLDKHGLYKKFYRR